MVKMFYLDSPSIDTRDFALTRQYPRWLPYLYNTEVERQVNEILSQSVVQPSTSSWASPFVDKRWLVPVLC